MIWLWLSLAFLIGAVVGGFLVVIFGNLTVVPYEVTDSFGETIVDESDPRLIRPICDDPNCPHLTLKGSSPLPESRA